MLWHSNHDRIKSGSVLRVKKTLPTPLQKTPPDWTVDTSQVGSMGSCCWCQILTRPPQQKSRFITAGYVFPVFDCQVSVKLCLCFSNLQHSSCVQYCYVARKYSKYWFSLYKRSDVAVLYEWIWNRSQWWQICEKKPTCTNLFFLLLFPGKCKLTRITVPKERYLSQSYNMFSS